MKEDIHVRTGMTFYKYSGCEQNGSGLILRAGTIFNQKKLNLAADLDIYNGEKLEFTNQFAMEKAINKDSSFKLRVKGFTDLDMALKTKLSQGLEVTFCTGMSLDEHTKEFIEKNL